VVLNSPVFDVVKVIKAEAYSFCLRRENVGVEGVAQDGDII